MKLAEYGTSLKRKHVGIRERFNGALNVRTLLPFGPGPLRPTPADSERMARLRERVSAATTRRIARENPLEVLHGIMVNPVRARRRVSRWPTRSQEENKTYKLRCSFVGVY